MQQLLSNTFHSLPTLVRVPHSRGRKEGATVCTHRNSSPAKIKEWQQFAVFYMDTTQPGNSPAQESGLRYFYESTAEVVLSTGLGEQTYTLNILCMWVQPPKDTFQSSKGTKLAPCKYCNCQWCSRKRHLKQIYIARKPFKN